MTAADDAGSTVRTCICCRRAQLEPTQLQTCHQCVGQVRADLTQIVDLYALLPTMLDGYPQRHTSGISDQIHRAAEAPLMGGDALALLAGGSDGGTQLDGHYDDDGRYLLPAHASDEQPDDPVSVLYELEREERDWRHERGLEPATDRATISNVAGFLHANLTWASQHHPGFDDSAAAISRLRVRLERAAGSSRQPMRTPVPCISCGGKLERRYIDRVIKDGIVIVKGGLDDHWLCRQCRRSYDDADYYLAMRAQAEARSEAG